MKMRSPLAISVALAVVCLSAALSTAQDNDRGGDARETQVMERFLTVLEKSPRRGTALDRVYGYHVERGSLDALVKTYQDRTAKDPADGTSWLLLGLIEAQRGKDAAAVSAFRKAEENRPTDAMAPYYLGQALVLVGQPDAAAEAFERALTKRPNRVDSLEIYQALGRVHQRAHHNDLALDVWKRFEKAFPDDARVQEQIAQSLADEGQNAPALDRYAILATKARDPYRKVQFALEAAELKVRLGKATDALNDFEGLLGKLEPESWLAREVRRKIEEVFLRNDDLAGLIAYYERWIKKTSDDVEAMARLGRTLANQGRAADARVWLEKAVTLAPSRRDLRLALIEQLAQDQKFADASKQYEELAKLEPNNPDVLRDWGKLLLRDTSKPEPDRKKAAAEVWMKLVGDAPKDAVAVSQAADLFRQASMVDDAIALYRKAIELAPDAGQYYEYLGDYYHALKRPTDALTAWKGIAEGKNRTARNLGRLGEVLAGFGYKNEALPPLLDANKLDDDDFDLRLKLADLYQQLDRADDCLKELALAARSAAGDEQNEAVLERQIKVELNRGTLGKRIDELAAELAKGKGDVAGWTKLARYHEANQKFPEAIAAINKAIEIDPKSIPTWLTVARLREQSGDIADAADANRTLASLDRRSRTDHLTNLAKLEARLGRRVAALAAGRDLLAAAPGNPEHHEYFAELCFQLGENDEGLEALRRSVRANPSEPKVMLVLGDNLAKQFRTEEAIELFWRAFDKTTDLDGKMNIVSKLADQYLQRNQIDRLIARLERELREPNQQRELSLCLAQAYASSGDIATARQQLEKLLAVNTRDTQLLNQLSTLSETEGDIALASKYQRQSMEIAPNPDGLNRLAQLYLRSGEVAEAEAVWSKLAGEDRDPARVLMAVDNLLNNNKPEAAQIITERLLSKAPNDWEALYRQAIALNALKKYDEADKRFQAILDLRLADNEEGAIGKARKKFGGTGSASNPAVRAAGTPATNRGQRGPLDAIQARSQSAFNIRLISKLDPQYVYYNSMSGYQFSPSDFGQARMAALAFRYVIARDAQKGDDFLKALKAVATAPKADVRTLWDQYYFEVVRQDTPATFEAARRLYRAAKGDVNAQYVFLTSLNGRVKNVNQRTVAQPGSPRDKTPPLPAEDLADALAAFKSLRQGAGDQVGFQFNVIRVELERARKTPEFDALYAEEKANASTFLRTAAVLGLAAERGDVPAVLELAERADRLRPKSTMPGQVDEGYTIGSWLARAMSVRADEKAHADVLKLLDVEMASLQKPENTARRAKARSGPSNAQMTQNGSVFQIYFGKNSRQVRLDYPSPNAYFDRGGIMALRAAYEYFKRDDLLSDLFQHIRKQAEAAQAADRIYPTLALSYLHWWNNEKDESLRELTAASDLLKGDVDLRLGLAELRAQRNEPAEALELLDTVEPLDQKTVQRKETLALRLAVMTGDVARAKKAAERLFGIRIDSELQLQLVTQMNQLGMSEMAEAILGRARRRAGANTATLVSLMSQYQRQGKTDTALQIANQILKSGASRRVASINNGDDMDYAQREAIQTISRSGKLKELIERAEKQLASSPNSTQALQSLADYYRATNDRDKLKATYERLLKVRPDDAQLRFQVANQLNQIGDVEGAVAQYKVAILKEPRLYAQRYWEIQNVFQRANKLEELIGIIDQIDFKTFGSYSYVIQELIQSTAQNEKFKDLSLKLFRKAWKEMPEGRANLISNLYDDNLWRLPEIYDYAREAVIPKADEASVDPWQSISHIYSWSTDSVTGVVTRLIEAATRQNKLDSLQKDVRAALKAHPEWVGGKALDLIIQIRKGRIEEGKKGLQELIDKEAEIPAYARLIVGQEVENIEECRALAIALYEKATSEENSGIVEDWEYSPERRLLKLYQKDGKKDQARALVRKAMSQPDDRYNYDPNYAAYRKINRNLALGSTMVQLGYPVEAVQLFEELLGDTESLQNGSMYFGSPDQILMQANRGLDQATAAIKGESLERALDSLLVANEGKNGKPVLNLLARVQPKEVDNATVRCLLFDTLQSIGKDPKLRTAAMDRLNSIAGKHPNDLSVAICLTVLAAQDADKTAFPKSLEAVEKILAARPLEDLPAGTRPNSRQREEAAARLPIWLVAREALRRDDTKDRGLKLQAIALEAARRQSENIWLLAMLRESGQSALERGDKAAAEAQWRLILREILKPPGGAKARPAQPQPGAGGPGPARVRTVPAAPARTGTSGASLATPGRATLVAFQNPAPAPGQVGAIQKTRVAPGATTAPAPTSTSLITVERFEQAIQLATLATQNGLHDLAFEAVRDSLETGPPIIPIAVNNQANMRAMRVNNGQPVADDPSPRVQLALGNLSTLWKRSNLPASKVYEALRDVVLPAKRPTEVFLHAKPIVGPLDVRQPRSLVANLIEWAEKAGTLDDLATRFEARASSPLASVPAQVALARIAITRKDEDALIRALDRIGQGSKGAGAASLDLTCHAAIPALAFPRATLSAATLIEAAARGSQNVQGMEEPARSYFILLAQAFTERKDVERARKAIRDYTDRAQTAASRYGGDYSLYLRKVTLLQVANVFSSSGLIDDALDALGQSVDAPTSSNQDPSAAATIRDIARGLRTRPATERYALWKTWTFPTANRRSVRLAGGVPLMLSPAIPEALKADAGPEITGFLSNSSLLVEAANEAGKLDELAAEAKTLADQKVENAPILLVRVELAQGKDERLRAIIKDRLVEIRKPKPPEPEKDDSPQNQQQYVRPTPHSLAEEVAWATLAEAVLLRGKLSPDDEEFLNDQKSQIRYQELTEYLATLQKELRFKDVLGPDALTAGLLPEGTGLIDWAMGAEQAGPRWTRSSIASGWTAVDGVVASTGNGTTMLYQIPIAGTFSVEAAFDSMSSAIGFGGRIAFPSSANASTVSSVGQQDQVARPAVVQRVNEANIARIDVSPGEVAYTINGHLFHKEPAGDIPNPWLTIGAPYNTTLLRSLRVTGRPEIPREVRLLGKDQLTGWTSPLGEAVRSGRTSTNRVGPDGRPIGASMVDYDWEAKDGVLAGRMGERQLADSNRVSFNASEEPSELSPATIEDSLIQHNRALRDGDSVSYSFLYEPGRTITHPAVGSLAFLIAPDGVKLHWAGLGARNPLGLPTDHAISDPSAKLSADKLDLRPGEWNEAVVAYKGGAISIALNGKLIYDRPLEKASTRRFGFYHDKKNTGAKVKDVVLRGDWPKALPADLLAPRGGPLSEKATLAQRLLRPGGNARATTELLAKADTLAPKDLYARIAPLCLPSEAFPSFAFHSEPGYPDEKIIGVAKKAGMLDDLADRLRRAPTRTEADTRTRKIFLAKVLAAQGKVEEARTELKQIAAIAAEEAKKRERGRFTFDAARAAFYAKELAPEALALLDENEQFWKARGAPTPLAFAPARSIRSQILFARDPVSFGTPAGDPKAGPWAAVAPFLPREKPSTIPYPRWSAKDGGWSAHSDQNASQLYLRAPLTGDFEVQAEVSAGVGREIGLAYGPIGLIPSKNLKRLDLRNYGRTSGVSSIEPAFKEVKESLPLSLKVRGSSITVSLDGRQVYEQTLPADRDPWLQLLTEPASEGTVKNLKILGNPTIPDSIKLSVRADLTGWLSDFTETNPGQSLWKKQGEEIVGQKSAPIKEDADPNERYYNRYGNDIVTPKLTSLPGSFMEDVLTYNRPILEDGEVTYEFFHDPGEAMVHPSLGRSAFLIDEGGVKLHAITIGSTEKAPIDPQNGKIDPAHRRGPAELPLKAKAWNTLGLKTVGDSVKIALNGVEVYEGPIAKDNPRFFGLFHYHDQTEARVKNVVYKGNWPKALPEAFRGGAKATASK